MISICGKVQVIITFDVTGRTWQKTMYMHAALCMGVCIAFASSTHSHLHSSLSPGCEDNPESSQRVPMRFTPTSISPLVHVIGLFSKHAAYKF